MNQNQSVGRTCQHVMRTRAESGRGPSRRPEFNRAPPPGSPNSAKEAGGGNEPPRSDHPGGRGGDDGGGGGNQGGGPSNGSPAGWSAEKKRNVLVLLVGAVALIVNQLFWVWYDKRKQEYNNTPAGIAEIQNARIKEETKQIEAQAELVAASGPGANASTAPLYKAPGASSSVQVVNDLTDGATAVIPENAKIILRGPMTMTMLNSAWKIRSYSGDFKVHIETTENSSWTPGFAPESPYMTPKDFFWHLRKHPEFPSRVTIQVNQGVVELNTTNLKE